MEAVVQAQQTIRSPQIKNINKIVTDYIVHELEQGVIPWRKPSNVNGNDILRLPFNPVTSNYYQKINIILLCCSAIKKNFTSNEWAGLKQWNTRKEAIRRNEKGTFITYYDAMFKEVNGQILKTPYLNYTYVFNRCQLVSFNSDAETKPERDIPFIEKIGKLDEFIANTKAIIEQYDGPARYSRATDKIMLPYGNDFEDEKCIERFYASLMPRLIHWTGASHRLNRYVGKEIGDHAYVTEELIAEFGAVFLRSELAMGTTNTHNHINIDSWLNVLKDNKHCLFSASSEASKAISYLMK